MRVQLDQGRIGDRQTGESVALVGSLAQVSGDWLLIRGTDGELTMPISRWQRRAARRLAQELNIEALCAEPASPYALRLHQEGVR